MDAAYLSVHDPNGRYPDGHRFHVKVCRKTAATIKAQGNFITLRFPCEVDTWKLGGESMERWPRWQAGVTGTRRNSSVTR